MNSCTLTATPKSPNSATNWTLSSACSTLHPPDVSILGKHLEGLSLPIDGLYLQDLRERDRSSAFVATEGQQTGTRLKTDGRSRLFPDVTSKLDHALRALKLKEMPSDRPAPLAEPTLVAIS